MNLVEASTDDLGKFKRPRLTQDLKSAVDLAHLVRNLGEWAMVSRIGRKCLDCFLDLGQVNADFAGDNPHQFAKLGIGYLRHFNAVNIGNLTTICFKQTMQCLGPVFNLRLPARRPNVTRTILNQQQRMCHAHRNFLGRLKLAVYQRLGNPLQLIDQPLKGGNTQEIHRTRHLAKQVE